MQPIIGAELIAPAVHADARGELIVFEGPERLPFPPARMFFLKTADRDTVRGGHANSCDELIVAMTGSVLAEIDNGTEESRVRLDRCDQALLVRAGVVVRLRDFAPDTLLLVCASALYADTRHFATPRPRLMSAPCRR
jgi:hypothetical protein